MTPEEVSIFVKLIGAREFVLAAESVGVSVGAMGVETDLASRQMEAASRRGLLATQALFTMRRLLYGFTLGLVAAGGAALDFGWKYNNAMQTARVALMPVFHNQQALNKELNYLFTLSKYTPFQFKDITQAFRQMYGGMHQLGIGSGTVNATIKSIVDALSFTGRTSPGALNRVAVALQHMAYQGHLTGQAVNQMNRDGIPATAILAKMFGLTGEQIHNISAQGIPTLKFLNAFNKYIASTPGFANAAYRQATQSLSGMWTTFKDNLGQIMGAMEKGFFGRLQNRIGGLNSFMGTFASRMRAHGGSFDKTLASVNPGVERIWALLGSDIHWFWVNLWNIINGIRTSKALWATLYVALQLIHGVLLAISPITAAFGGYLNILIPLIVVWYTVTKLATIYQWLQVAALQAQNVELILQKNGWGKLTFSQFAALAATRAYTAATKVAIAVQGLWSIATLGYVRGAGGQFRALTSLEKMVLKLRVATLAFTAAIWESTIALLANPLTWIIIGVVALTAGLIILYFKWRAFHDAINNTARFMVRWAPLMAAALTIAFGPIGAALGAILLIIKYWKELRNFFGGGGSGGTNPYGTFSSGGFSHTAGATPFFPGVSPGFRPLPAFAGATVNVPQQVDASNRGVTVPAHYGIGYSNAPQERPYKIQVVMDKKVVSDVTAEQIAQAKRRG